MRFAKVAYIDPLDITITSLATNISWKPGNTGATVYGCNYGYEFKYDGWSNTGTPTPTFKRDSENDAWYINAEESFTNTDFEAIVVDILGNLGYAACGFDSSPATYTDNPYVFGYDNGGGGWETHGSKKGGCVDLTRKRTVHGWGTSD